MKLTRAIVFQGTYCSSVCEARKPRLGICSSEELPLWLCRVSVLVFRRVFKNFAKICGPYYVLKVPEKCILKGHSGVR